MPKGGLPDGSLHAEIAKSASFCVTCNAMVGRTARNGLKVPEEFGS